MKKGKLALLSILIFSLALFLSGCGFFNQSPTAVIDASPVSGVPPLEVNFDASESSDPDGNILEYTWDFGDGSTGAGKTTTHTFQGEGNYTVTLTVKDDGGATDSTTKEIEALLG